MADRPLTIDIREPTLVKGGELFLVTNGDGAIPGNAPGMGLFYRDCRYLSHYQLLLNGAPPLFLMGSSELGFASATELTNRPTKTSDGTQIPQHTIAIRRRRIILEDEEALVDRIQFRNFHTERIGIPVSLTFEARFEDIFMLRGDQPENRGTMRRPEADGRRLRFAYTGADRVLRRLHVQFSSTPSIARQTTKRTGAHFTIELNSQQTRELVVVLWPDECRDTGGNRRSAKSRAPLISARRLESYQRGTAAHWLDGFAELRSDHPILDKVFHRSLSDLRLLLIRRDGRQFPAAGIPWFVALFGRDSLIPSLQCLAFSPEVARLTLRVLAEWQGKTNDSRHDEQPGKILHELRVGEMTNTGEVPQNPNYGSIDSTILFLILLARHAAWTGSLALFEELRENVERALAWMRDYGAGEDGYVKYRGSSDGRPVNQGWKDSGEAVVRPDGSFPTPPIALAEVQGYAYLAKIAIAELYRLAGEAPEADRLIREAEELRRRFNRDFWMEDEGCYCLALEQDNSPVRAVTSNAGQVLWSGIADHEKAVATIRRLMLGDMFSGWGVRTLSSHAARYNPIAYHLGSIWPFDNSLIVSGFRRYGGDQPALQIFDAILDAAQRFRCSRLPEFFAGIEREEGAKPVHCPRANPLQAWTAGALPLMLTALLGLEPEGFKARLRVIRPVFPAGVDWLELHGIRLSSGSVDLRFERKGKDVSGSVLRSSGGVSVVFE